MALKEVIPLVRFFDTYRREAVDLEWLYSGHVVVSTHDDVLSYLSRYLSGIDARLAVVESDYIDRDYLEDYARYYSKCLLDYNRKCYRIHFFSCVATREDLERFICPLESSTESGNAKVDFLGVYLGFVVIRPLPKTVVGRTCLVPYSTDGTGRHYLALRQVDVSFFGRDFTLRCMPFQEQDSSTAACATCALWSAFQVTAELFGHKTYFPSDITALAVEHVLSETRKFPNGGLYLTDMIYAIRRIGLDPICVDVGMEREPKSDDADSDQNSGSDAQENLSILIGAVYAYLGAGIPIILTGYFEHSSGEKYGEGGHAVAINGYHLGDNGATETSWTEHSWLVSDEINKIYVHDDQIGPGARILLDQNEIQRWRTDWHDKDSNLYLVPTTLMIPVYSKIRVSYEEVRECVAPVSEGLTEAIKMLKESKRLPEDFEETLKWDITLQKSKSYKRSLHVDSQLERGRKLKCMNETYSKYIWVVTVFAKKRKEISFIIDATDSGQGLRAIDVIMYSQTLLEACDALFLAQQEQLKVNPLMSKMEEVGV